VPGQLRPHALDPPLHAGPGGRGPRRRLGQRRREPEGRRPRDGGDELLHGPRRLRRAVPRPRRLLPAGARRHERRGGPGGTGQAALQIGKALGARVIATAGGPEKAEFCRALGADHVVDYRSEDIAEGVKAATGGRGADAIYDPVGGEAFASATQCVAHEGRILAIGFASGSWGRVDTSHLVYNNYSVVGVIPSRYDRAFKERAQERLLGWWREGRLRPRIDELVPFAELPDALERLVAGGVKGKLVLAVDASATGPA
jgi:hypothetical protein